MEKIAIAVLCSGGGTNLQALIDAQNAGNIPHGEIKLVVADRADAYALTRAKNHQIKTEIADRKLLKREEREEAILCFLKQNHIELVILAGFLTVLSEKFVKQYEGRILNIHPSLIPSFCGEGFYGLKVHEAALSRGVKVTGATVHYVTEVCDGGPIILQKAVEVKEGDTPEMLQKRVMLEAEWVILPKACEIVSEKLYHQKTEGTK